MYHEFFLLLASWDFELSKSCDDFLICFKKFRFQIFKILRKNVNPHAGGTYKSLSLQGASCSCQLPVYCRSSTGQCRWDNFSAFAQLRPNETSFNRCMAAKLAVRKAWVTLMTLGYRELKFQTSECIRINMRTLEGCLLQPFRGEFLLKWKCNITKNGTFAKWNSIFES